MKRVGIVVYPAFQILDTSVAGVFEMANLGAGKKVYELALVSDCGGAVKSSMGAAVQSIALNPACYDTLLVTGANGVPSSTPRLQRLLVRALQCTRRTASICTGAFILADAGVLDGRRATTHWLFARELQRRFPAITVEEDRIFVRDGRVWTSAGMTACIDLALAMVEGDLGSEVASAVAKKLVVHYRRAGGQSQFSSFSDLEAKSDRIRSALTYAKNHLNEELSVERLADVVNVSPRHFSREFKLNTGQSPARAIERLRAEVARNLVEESHSTLERIADQTGFSDPERMRRAFLRLFGQPPQAIKRAARARAATELMQ